jgi:hypothetical protein
LLPAKVLRYASAVYVIFTHHHVIVMQRATSITFWKLTAVQPSLCIRWAAWSDCVLTAMLHFLRMKP